MVFRPPEMLMKNGMTRRQYISQMSAVGGIWFLGLVLITGIITNGLTSVSWLVALGAVLVLDGAFLWINFNLYRHN
jgi:hypothetical protein